MDRSIVDTAITSRKCKRETYKKIILLIASYVVHMKLVHNWELGRRSFLNPLYRGTEKDCIEQLRLSKSAFFYHCRILQENETISRQFNDVLRTVMKVSKDYLNFQPYTLEGAKANKWRWFKRCIRALDGTHIPITVSPDKRPRYRNSRVMSLQIDTGHGAKTAMDVDEAMSKEINEVKFMDLGAIATIDIEESNSNTKGKRQGLTSFGTHSHKRKIGEKKRNTNSLDKMVNS
ncbi:hypothetical protein HKD37_20G055469 [Glycine soja]